MGDFLNEGSMAYPLRFMYITNITCMEFLKHILMRFPASCIYRFSTISRVTKSVGHITPWQFPEWQ